MYRFQSIADEPGGVGTTCAFLLFLTSGNKIYKYQYIIFWIAGLISFSFAFYIMAAFHLLFSTSNRKTIIYILFVSILAMVLNYYFSDAFEKLILDRFNEGDYNRYGESFNIHFQQALDNGTLWFPNKMTNEDAFSGAGVKYDLYRQGIFAIAMLFLSYTTSYFRLLKGQKANRSNRFYCLAFLFVFWMSYYQRTYITMMQYVLPFFFMPVFQSNKEIKD